MKLTIRSMSTCIALALSLGSMSATAGPAKTITLMQFSDLHGKMVPHQEIFQGDRAQNYSGGLTKMATAIKEVRADDPDALLLMVGDTTHGSAETLFTMGNSVMNAVNSLGVDAFTPGNWDFGHGPRAFRNRFAGANLPLPPNNRTTLSSTIQACPGDAALCNVIKANFDTVAINLYNYNEALGKIGPRVLPPFKMLESNGVKVAVILSLIHISEPTRPTT